MDLEAIQLLNLSPIPELSELELSTMLDHLSNLSDVNGDVTDRNVEDILKEAEDLLDVSTSSKTQESKDVINSPKTEEKLVHFVNPYINDLKDYEEHNVQHSNFENKHESKHNNTPIKSDHYTPQDIYADNNDSNHYNSPVNNRSTEIYSPRSSCNHIKSAIDSLKEFSAIIEQTLSSRSSNSSPKCSEITKLNEKELQKEVTISSNPLSINKKIVSLKQVSDCSKTVKIQDFKKKNISEPFEKSVKLLNCFERLYQDRPVRLCTNKKPKTTDRMPKTVVKKKFSKDLKNKKNSWQGKSVSKKTAKDVKDSSKIYNEMNDSLLSETSRGEWNFLKFDKTSSQYSALNNPEELLSKKKTGKEAEDEHLKESSLSEKPMLRGLEEVEEMKDQVKIIGVFPEKIIKEDEKVIDGLKPKVDSVEETLSLEMEKSSSIKKLEEQFSNLKVKYYHQIEKLEAENSKLREALNNQSKIPAAQVNANTEVFKDADVTLPTEKNGYKTSLLSSPPCNAGKKMMQSFSLETNKTLENSLCPLPGNFQPSTNVKEAFSQTEKELKSASVQCSEECKSECKDVGTDGKADIILEARKAENKENLAMKKKLGKSRPFSDVNVYQFIQKQKKTFDHETQLLATLRGLQTEMNVKDKENRKLKTEMESLRRQIKRLTQTKVENCRKCNIGTQTLGLGLFVQKPYNPENYEVSQELESENDELRSRIKALEEDFELLKEKRISDLQSLHQIHEEEMAKLVSKLETQSALTRHLHSLLVNR